MAQFLVLIKVLVENWATYQPNGIQVLLLIESFCIDLNPIFKKFPSLEIYLKRDENKYNLSKHAEIFLHDNFRG